MPSFCCFSQLRIPNLYKERQKDNFLPQNYKKKTFIKNITKYVDTLMRKTGQLFFEILAHIIRLSLRRKQK